MVTTVIVISFGTVQVILGQLTMGKLLGFLQLSNNVDGPIEALTSAVLAFTASKPSVNNMVGLLQAEEEVPGTMPPQAGPDRYCSPRCRTSTRTVQPSILELHSIL
jgi:ABC-type bacteriocin/lantibiotic exporter with double-glycine peptidase domain